MKQLLINIAVFILIFNSILIAWFIGHYTATRKRVIMRINKFKVTKIMIIVGILAFCTAFIPKQEVEKFPSLAPEFYGQADTGE